MSKKSPLGAHLTKTLHRVALFDGTLTAYNFGQNGQNANFFWPITKQAKSRFWRKKLCLDFYLFCPRTRPKHEPNLKSASKYGTFVTFFDTLDFEKFVVHRRPQRTSTP